MTDLRVEIIARSAEFSNSVDLYLNKRKNTEKIVYRQKVKEDEVQLAYLSTKEKTYATEAKFIDWSETVKENINEINLRSDSYQVIESNSFTWPSLDILITDETMEIDGIEFPVFFGMNLPGNTQSAKINSESKSLYWNYISDSKVLISNRTSILDEGTLEYDPVTVTVVTSTDSKKEVFSGRPLFQEATFEDIDPVTLEYYPNRKVYQVEKLLDGRYRFEVNTRKRIYIKEVSPGKISLKREKKINRNEPWLLKVKEGSFRRGSYLYKVNEFSRQVFYPREPFITYTSRGTYLGNGFIKVDEENIIVDPTRKLHLSISIRDEANNLKKAYTTNTTKIGKAYNRWDWNSTDIKWEGLSASADYKNGVFLTDIDFKILSTDYIQVQYVIEEKYFRIRDLNLNPNYNNLAADLEWWIFVKSNRPLEENSIGWLGLEKAGSQRVIRSNTDELIGLTKNQVIEEYMCMNPETKEDQENEYQWFLLGAVSVKNKENFLDRIIKDIRLEPTVKKDREILKRHPHLFFSKSFEERPLEIVDKKVLIFEVDKSRFLEEQYLDKIKSNLDLGSLGISTENIKPRINKAVLDLDRNLTVEVMSEPETIDYKIVLENGVDETILYNDNPGYTRGLITLGPFDCSSSEGVLTVRIELIKDGSLFGSSIKIQV